MNAPRKRAPQLAAERVEGHEYRYGAPMGRTNYTRTADGRLLWWNSPADREALELVQREPLRFNLQRVRLDSGGYDAGGVYWGTRSEGCALYLARSTCRRVFRSLDAESRAEACTILADEFPNASIVGESRDTYGPRVDVLSVDAWREAGGGWTWNDWRRCGTVPSAWCDLKPRALLFRLRQAGYFFKPGSVAVEDDGHNVVIVAKGTREPLIALEYGSNH
jgi:hypothetical protein